MSDEIKVALFSLFIVLNFVIAMSILLGSLWRRHKEIQKEKDELAKSS